MYVLKHVFECVFAQMSPLTFVAIQQLNQQMDFIS